MFTHTFTHAYNIVFYMTTDVNIKFSNETSMWMESQVKMISRLFLFVRLPTCLPNYVCVYVSIITKYNSWAITYYLFDVFVYFFFFFCAFHYTEIIRKNSIFPPTVIDVPNPQRSI